MDERFLIVDDSPVIRLTLKKHLVRAGIREENILDAEEGEAGLQIHEKESPDVVFMDIDMPGMDGEQAANMMMRSNPEVKIVIITGLNTDDDRVRNLLSMGAFQIIEKPVHSDDVEELMALLDREESGAGRIH